MVQVLDGPPSVHVAVRILRPAVIAAARAGDQVDGLARQAALAAGVIVAPAPLFEDVETRGGAHQLALGQARAVSREAADQGVRY